MTCFLVVKFCIEKPPSACTRRQGSPWRKVGFSLEKSESDFVDGTGSGRLSELDGGEIIADRSIDVVCRIIRICS